MIGGRGWQLVRDGLLLAVAAAGLAAAPTGYAHLRSRGRIVPFAAVPPQPVALVLGAEVYADGQPSRYLQARLDLAHRLFIAGKVQVLLVSGDSGSAHYDETGGMRDYLIEQGVPPERIVRDHAGFDTYDSCVRARRVFGVTSAIVVSQTYHLPRAVATCLSVGVDAWGVGDETAKANQQMWSYGSAREVGANIKMAWDLLSRRRPVLGPREPGVDEALART